MVIPVSTKPLTLHNASVGPSVLRTMFQNRAMPLSGKSAGNDLSLVVCRPCLPTRAGEKRARQLLRLMASPVLKVSDRYHHAESPHRTGCWSTTERSVTLFPLLLVMVRLVRPFDPEVLISMSTITVSLAVGLLNLELLNLEKVLSRLAFCWAQALRNTHNCARADDLISMRVQNVSLLLSSAEISIMHTQDMLRRGDLTHRYPVLRGSLSGRTLERDAGWGFRCKASCLPALAPTLVRRPRDGLSSHSRSREQRR
jgi:hypothetical protein